MNRILFLAWILLLAALTSSAQEESFRFVDSSLLEQQLEEPLQETMKEGQRDPDTGVNVHPVVIPADSLISWRNKKEFAYLQNIDSLLRDLEKENNARVKQESQQRNFSAVDRFLNSELLRNLLWLMAALFVAFLLYQLFISKAKFRKKPGLGKVAEQLSEDQLFLVQDYAQMATRALQQEDFRGATRYRFLETLKKLHDASLIEFAADKTNSKYVMELPPGYRKEFAALVLNYEYSWYGHLVFSREQYHQVEQMFINFSGKIKNA